MNALLDVAAMPKRATNVSDIARAKQANLRVWRKFRNLTLEQLAEQIGSKVSTLSGWETGRRAVDLDDLYKLASFYSISVDALLSHPEAVRPEAEAMREASSLVERMTEEQAKQWLAIGAMLASKKAE